MKVKRNIGHKKAYVFEVLKTPDINPLYKTITFYGTSEQLLRKRLVCNRYALDDSQDAIKYAKDDITNSMVKELRKAGFIKFSKGSSHGNFGPEIHGEFEFWTKQKEQTNEI